MSVSKHLVDYLDRKPAASAGATGRGSTGSNASSGSSSGLGTHALDGPEHTPATGTDQLLATIDHAGLMPPLSGNPADALRGDGTVGPIVATVPNIEEMATAETDTTLVFAPDGAGGVVARAETVPALDDLSDVDAPTPSDGDVLTWDSGTGKWIAQAPTGGGGGSSLTVEEVDGSPTDSAITKIVFPNATIGIASHVATYTPAAGGGGASAPPNVYQMVGSSGLNTTNPAITIVGVASGHRMIVGLNLVGRSASSLSCTNTTFTLMNASTSGGGSRYEIWVGVVAGGASGTTLTVNTGSSNFASIVMIEVDDALTPTAGSSYDAAATMGNLLGPLSGVTAGHFVAMLVGEDNTTNPLTSFQFGVPGWWYARQAAGTGMALAVLYSTGSAIQAVVGPGSLAGWAIFQEIT